MSLDLTLDVQERLSNLITSSSARSSNRTIATLVGYAKALSAAHPTEVIAERGLILEPNECDDDTPVEFL